MNALSPYITLCISHRQRHRTMTSTCWLLFVFAAQTYARDPLHDWLVTPVTTEATVVKDASGCVLTMSNGLISRYTNPYTHTNAHTHTNAYKHTYTCVHTYIPAYMLAHTRIYRVFSLPGAGCPAPNFATIDLIDLMNSVPRSALAALDVEGCFPFKPHPYPSLLCNLLFHCYSIRR